jgi:hypothetical protein
MISIFTAISKRVAPSTGFTINVLKDKLEVVIGKITALTTADTFRSPE